MLITFIFDPENTSKCYLSQIWPFDSLSTDSSINKEGMFKWGGMVFWSSLVQLQILIYICCTASILSVASEVIDKIKINWHNNI